MKAVISPVELFGEEITFVAGVIKDNVMPPEYISVLGLLTDPKYHSLLDLVDDYDYGYKIIGGAVLPVLTDYDEDSDNVIELEGDLDIKHLGDMVLFDDDMSDIDELLSELISNYDGNKFKQMCTNVCNTLYQIEQYNFKYNLNRKVPADIKAIADKYNSESKGSGVVETALATGNLTLEMGTCESELFVEIPAPYYNPNAKDLDEYATDFMSPFEVMKALDPYDGNIEACSPNSYLRVADIIGLENIIGNSENNHLPIQQNERRFYEALKRYIYKSLELYLSKEGNLTNAELESRIKNNVLPVHIRLVLESFVKSFVNVNWRHSMLVPSNEFKPDADSEDDDSDSDGGSLSDSADLKSEYDFGNIDTSRVSLDSLSTRLNHYLVSIENLMKNNLTAYAWAELIVKLARWGSRKPTHVIFTEEASGTSCNAMLNINEFQLEEDLSYLDQLDTVKYGDSDYLPLSVISTDVRDLCDTSEFCEKIGIDYDNAISYSILGLRCRQDFITAKGSRGRNVYFDLLTIIDLYRSGKGSIFGIEYDGETFTVDKSMEARFESYMPLSSILSLLGKPENFMEKIFTNECMVKELSVSKSFTVKDKLAYSLYNILNRLLFSQDIIGEFGKADKLDNPKDWAVLAMSKCVLSYAFLPQSEKSTLEKALNNMNELYKGFEDIELDDSTSDTEVDKTAMFSQPAKEYKAVKKLDIGGGCVYYLVPTVEDSPDGFKGILADDTFNIINKDSVETFTGVKARFNLGRLVYETEKNMTTSGIYLSPDLLEDIKKKYLEIYCVSIMQDYVATATKLQQAKRG